jgi:hypothetical protein
LEVKLKSPAKRIGRWVDWVRGRRESLRKEDLALGQMGQYELMRKRVWPAHVMHTD